MCKSVYNSVYQQPERGWTQKLGPDLDLNSSTEGKQQDTYLHRPSFSSMQQTLVLSLHHEPSQATATEYSAGLTA
jgi:hypothetical protein